MISKTLQQCYLTAKKAFQDAKLSTADLDADLLVSWVTATTRLDRVSRPDIIITGPLCHELDCIIERRLKGEPVHRIMGKRNFYGRDFELNESTLEPRPDTETLIDAILPYMHEIAQQKPQVNIVDMGTGSGAIAVTLACEEPKAQIVGVDIAQAALDMAQKNARQHGVDQQFTPCLSNWFEKLSGTFDIIVSNPPYIPRQDIEKLDYSVRHYDPIAALDGGDDGLYFYKELASHSRHFLQENGIISVEIGINQENDVISLFAQHGFKLLESVSDLAGIIRVLLFKNAHD